MATVNISGYGDDHIVVNIDGKKDEFNCYESGDTIRFIGLSDGTLLRVTYGVNDEAIWRIALLRRGTATFSIQQAIADGDEYSDTATLESESKIQWAICSKDKPISAR